MCFDYKNLKYILFFFFTIIIAHPLFSQPYYPEIQLNSNVEIGIYKNSDYAILENGNIVITYGLNTMGFQILSPSGEKLYNEVEVKYRHRPFLVSAVNNNQFLTCCQKDVSKVVVQRYTETGEPVGDECRLNPDTQGYGVIITHFIKLKNDNFLVVWFELNDNHNYDYYGKYYAQILTPLCQKVGSYFPIDSYPQSYKYQTISITPLSNNGFIAGWRDFQDFFSIQFFDESGNYNSIKTYVLGRSIEKAYKPFIEKDDGSIILLYDHHNESTFTFSAVTITNNNSLIISEPKFLSNYTYWYEKFFTPFLLDNNEIIIFKSSIPGYSSNENSKVYYYSLDLELNISEPTLISSFPKETRYNISIQKIDDTFFMYWGNRENSPSNTSCMLLDKNLTPLTKEFIISNSFNKYNFCNPFFFFKTENKFMACWLKRMASRPYEFNCKIMPKNFSRKLKSFSLLEPLNDQTISTTAPLFKWASGQEQDDLPEITTPYKLYLADNVEFNNPTIVNIEQDTTKKLSDFTQGQTYFWKVLALNLNGDSLWSEDINAFFVSHTATNVAEPTEIFPHRLSLNANYPNPFNPSTTISYSIPSSGHVTIKIYDITGRLVNVLYNNTQQAGTHSLAWNGTDLSGHLVAAGIYLYQIEYTNVFGQRFTLSKKMSFVK